MFVNKKLHYVVIIVVPEGQPSHLSQLQRWSIGVYQPGNVTLCIDTLPAAEQERVYPDDFLP